MYVDLLRDISVYSPRNIMGSTSHVIPTLMGIAKDEGLRFK